MPSGRTHDVITLLLAVPAAALGYAAAGGVAGAVVIAAAFVFGGLMFGPDLDTVSRQYTRWSVFRFLWLPYRSFFTHRSRFSHGLIFGALIRVVYFMGAFTLVAIAAVYLYTWYSGGRMTGIDETAKAWIRIGRFTRDKFGEYCLLLVFVGLWLGAASHTFTDMAGSFIKTGRIGKIL